MTDHSLTIPRVPEGFLAVFERVMAQWGRGALLEGAIAIEHLVDEVLAAYLAAPGRSLLLRGTVLAQIPMSRKVDVLKDVLVMAGFADEHPTLVPSIKQLIWARNLLAHADGPHEGGRAAELGNPQAAASDEGLWFRRYRKAEVEWEQLSPGDLEAIVETARKAPAVLERLRDQLASA